MTIELLQSKKLDDMTNAELAELRESISKIEIERMKVTAKKIHELFFSNAG